MTAVGGIVVEPAAVVGGVTAGASANVGGLVVGPPTTVGSGGTAVTFYQHTQTTPATVWTVVHSLGRRPAAVSVFSADWSIEYSDFGVIHVDATTLYITADLAIAGKALVE